jgi:RND family efflux transporter MFP subunit
LSTVEANPIETQDGVQKAKTAAPKPPSHYVALSLIALTVVLGVVIYEGIRERAQAESRLGNATELAAVATVSVVHPNASAADQEIVLPGTSEPFNDTPIYARTNGYLKHWYVDIGTRVHAGQLLAEIDTPEIDQQLDQARADLKSAKANEQLAAITAARWQNLLKTNSVSKQETDQAVSDLSAKQAAVDSMSANVHRLEQLQSFEKIYAPFAGVITARNTDIGALIDAGASTTPRELFHMASVNRLRVFVAVPEVDSRAARNGAIAKLTLDEFPGKIFHGTIVRNSDSIDLASRTLNVEVDVDNPGDRIKTGAYVFVHLDVPPLAQAGSRSVVIPANALLFRAEGLRVGVVRNNRAELVPIKIGRDYGATLEVVTGLKATDEVILNPSDSLISGTPVRLGAGNTDDPK